MQGDFKRHTSPHDARLSHGCSEATLDAAQAFIGVEPGNTNAAGERRIPSSVAALAAVNGTVRSECSVSSYAHLLHHGPSEGGTTDYSRSDAQRALGLTATLAARTVRP